MGSTSALAPRNLPQAAGHLRALVLGDGEVQRAAREYMTSSADRAEIFTPRLPRLDSASGLPEGLEEALDADHERREQQERHVAETADTLRAMYQATAKSEAHNRRMQWAMVLLTAAILLLTIILVLRPT